MLHAKETQKLSLKKWEKTEMEDGSNEKKQETMR